MSGYDRDAICDGLTAIVAGRGRLILDQCAAAGLSALLVPDAAEHSPIRLRVVADECHFWFGSGTHASLGYGGPGDEDDVLSSIQAVINGMAWERFAILPGGSIHGLARIVAHTHESEAGGDVPIAFERRVPAWPSSTAR